MKKSRKQRIEEAVAKMNCCAYHLFIQDDVKFVSFPHPTTMPLIFLESLLKACKRASIDEKCQTYGFTLQIPIPKEFMKKTKVKGGKYGNKK